MLEASTHQQRYAGLARSLAIRALALAGDASPHRAASGERRWSLTMALPAARLLLGGPEPGDAEALAPAAVGMGDALSHKSGRVTDGFGHHRPAYALLALHLLGTAARRAGRPDAVTAVEQAVGLVARHRDTAEADPRLAVWHRLLAPPHREASAAEPYNHPPGPAPLLPHLPDDLLDAWTYHELVGLHGLHLIATITGDGRAARRVRSAAAFHMGHTQPDYTTYQPWALAAFAADPETAVFAEQQLHDVQTHLAIEGPGGALLPALLLADAAATLDATMLQA